MSSRCKLLTLVTLAGLAVLPGYAGAQLQFLAEFGPPGPLPDINFSQPHGIAIGPSGRVYLTVNTRFAYVYYPDGNMYTQWWTSLKSHYDIVVDAAENSYIIGFDNNIKRFNSAGGFTGVFGSPGTLAGQFNLPTGIDLDASGNIYVADSGNYRIQKLSPTGAFLDVWGGHGSGPGQFLGPVDVEVGNDGNIYVVDNGIGSSRIEVFSPDGTFLREWSYTICAGSATIRGIAFDAANNILAAGGSCLTKMDQFGTEIYSFGSQGSGPGQFNGLYDVTVAADGLIFTVESQGTRIQKFSEDSVPVETVTWGRIKSRF